jgi:hypothetical protein
VRANVSAASSSPRGAGHASQSPPPPLLEPAFSHVHAAQFPPPFSSRLSSPSRLPRTAPRGVAAVRLGGVEQGGAEKVSFSIYLIFNVNFVLNCMLTIIISFELSCPVSDFFGLFGSLVVYTPFFTIANIILHHSSNVYRVSLFISTLTINFFKKIKDMKKIKYNMIYCIK